MSDNFYEKKYIDSTTLAYINLYGVIGDIQNLCKLDEKAKQIATTNKPVSIAFNVTDGPTGSLFFDGGNCTFEEGLKGKIGLKLLSCEDFNLLVDGKKTPLPYKGFLKLGFALKNFGQLTDLLATYLRADANALKDRAFFEKSTELMFYLIVTAMAQIANHDHFGKISAKRIRDGVIQLEIGENIAAHLVVRGNKMKAFYTRHSNPDAIMKFRNLDIARGLFEGTKDAMSCVALGDIEMRGFIPMIDNLNKILARVGLYLA
ncbi:MAG: hypothetical protein RRY78_00315 [Clostridia bacterium]